MRRVSVLSFAATTACLIASQRRICQAANLQRAVLRPFAILAFSISGILVTAPAGATTFPVALDNSGGVDGVAFAEECKEGEWHYLIGFATRIGAWLDQIAPICAAFSATGTVSNSNTGEKHGGEGGNPRVEACPANAFLTGIRFGRPTASERRVGFVELHCTTGDGAVSTICIGGSQHGCYGVLNRHDPGFETPTVFTPTVQTCPSGEVATAFRAP